MTVDFTFLALSQQTFLDWANAIGVPIIVVLIAGIFGLISRQTGNRAQEERELQEDRAREETLRSYLDRIADLVLEKGLGESEIDSPERAIALARTHNVLTTLDGRRKGLLVRYLKASQLIHNGRTVLPLNLADLTNSDLSGADLRACDFSGANLSNADFYDADLRNCNFENCVLTNEQLAQCAQLNGAILPNGDLATEQTLEQLQIEDRERWSVS
jgi:hypothetical protein